LNLPSPSNSKTQRELPARGRTWTQSILRRIDSLSDHLGRTPAIAPHLRTGLRGEEEAFFYLRQHGYIVVARRWRTPKVPGDVDLIAWKGDTLCFIEVKTRTHRDIVPAEFAVDQQKQRTLRSMASVFRKRFPEKTRQDLVIRFDVVSVYLPARSSDFKVEIELFPAAFSRHAG
jgi:putative endonuclease